MKNCKKIQKYIVFRELNIEKAKNLDFEEHISNCKECNSFLSSLKEMEKILKMYEIEPSDRKFSFDYRLSKIRLNLAPVIDALKYSFAIILIILGISFFIEYNQTKKIDETFINLAFMEKSKIEVISNFDFYSDNELFDNLELISNIDEEYENI